MPIRRRVWVESLLETLLSGPRSMSRLSITMSRLSSGILTTILLLVSFPVMDDCENVYRLRWDMFAFPLSSAEMFPSATMFRLSGMKRASESRDACIFPSIEMDGSSESMSSMPPYPLMSSPFVFRTRSFTFTFMRPCLVFARKASRATSSSSPRPLWAMVA